MLRISVLGPIEVRQDDSAISLAGPRQRALLAALVLDHDKAVSVDRLVDLLWESEPPATARAKVQSHVSALRQAIGQRGADGPLLTRPPGYLLSTRGLDLDLAEFTGLTAQGAAATTSGQMARAAELFGTALALWRGQAFADVRSAPLRTAADVIGERRLLAAEAKAEADLALGRCETVVVELSGWLAAYPLRERVRALLMRALCGLGCRADALAIYRAGRQIMVEELGLEPGEQLRGLQQRILANDPVS